ncbi:MAG: rod shape-determining protein MreC [Bacteroidetes bacterium]|nr:rod shape-determining protein MreC [Bacteroidota bacterium]
MLFLFRFLRNNLFTVTFILLFGISVFQILRFNLYQQSFYFNTSNAVLNSADRLKNNVTGYFYLRKANEDLVLENKRLREQLAANYVFYDTQTRSSKDSHGVLRYTYLIGRVISSTVSSQNNFITIDKGRTHGVRKGMAVLSPAGIAGIVLDVSDHFALVSSVLNSKFVATPMIPAINFREGSLTWNGEDPTVAQINGVNKFEKISPGMAVFTSNYSANFPPGVPIGRIKSFRRGGNSSFFEINVELATDFRKISTVYLVKDAFRQEIDSLAGKENRNGR